MSRVIAPLALVIAVLSLAANLLLIQRLNQGRLAAIDALDRTSQRLGSLPDASIHYNLRFKRDFAVAGDLPFNQQLTIPISVTVPINTSIKASVNTPLGPVDVPVTVDTTFPIKMDLPVTISRTVPYSLTIPLDLDVPVDIPLRSLGVDASVKDAQDEIQRLRSALQ